MSDPAKLTVSPRKPGTNAERPIITVSVIRDQWGDENGETGTIAELSTNLRGLEPSILACDHSAELLAVLDKKHRFDPCWQFSVTPLERQVFQPAARPGNSMVLSSTVVNFLGWRRSPGSNRNTPNLYHLCIDPITFASFPLVRGDHDTLAELAEWAQNLREFCVTEQINLRPTQGSVARQFLRDPRFYPKPRRKVPRATNERVRKNLPGNIYLTRLYGDDKMIHRACIYIDQSRAHHYHASREALPDPDTLMAYGNFHGEHPEPWRTSPTRINQFLDGFHGMIAGQLEWRDRSLPWRPPCLEHPSGHPVVWFTSERDMLDSLGVRCTRIDAAWGSRDLDYGLNAYATWALDKLGENPPLWLKTLLLSTYGTLATRARKHAIGYSKITSRKAEALEIRAGRSSFTAMMRAATKEAEPSVNNVLHRGLIEAATRTESLMFANYLQQHGHQTLAVYADALIVQATDRPLPVLLPPWRVKAELHNVQFISSNAFVSDEMSKIPGGLSRREQADASLAERRATVRARGPGYELRMALDGTR